MELTVLGRCGPYPRALEACSGYLVRSGDTRLLLECGAGVLARLRAAVDLSALDAIFISHLHYDHCADMSVLRYALEQFLRAPLPVYCPAAPEEARALFDYPVFEPRPVTDGMRAQIGAFDVTFHKVQHPVPAFAMRLDDGKGRLFFTGDTGWFDGLPALASGADAILADCCFTDADADKRRIHLSAREAGRLAAQAGAKTLYCTHLWGGANTDEAVQKEVDFSPAVVVQEGRQYAVPAVGAAANAERRITFRKEDT